MGEHEIQQRLCGKRVQDSERRHTYVEIYFYMYIYVCILVVYIYIYTQKHLSFRRVSRGHRFWVQGQTLSRPRSFLRVGFCLLYSATNREQYLQKRSHQ